MCFETDRGPEVCEAEEIHTETLLSVSVSVDGLLAFVLFDTVIEV